MESGWILLWILFYFLILYLVGYFLSRKAGYQSYFNANRNVSWILITIGMIGDSLSGVTFISVPGKVYTDGFSYLQVVLGYVAGYWLIATVLIPVYYKYRLTSVYEWLGIRFHSFAQKTGSIIFIISRLTGAAARLYLSVWVFYEFILKKIFPVHFLWFVLVILALIFFYTRKGGIRVLVYTDTFQSIVLFLSLIICVAGAWFSLPDNSVIVGRIFHDSMSRIIISDFSHPHFFWKDFLGGMLICLGMTGLDQNMMQKNLSCRSREDAALNLKMFSGVVLVVNIFFLLLGYLLYHQEMVKEWINEKGVIQTDSVFPAWVLENGTKWIIIWFVLGLTAASFNSADSVMTTLTTSWYIDVLGNKPEESSQEKTRTRIHAFFALAIFVCITLFYFFNNNALIDTVLFLGGVTYGPLLGIFLFGLLFSGNISPLRLMLVIISGMTIGLMLYYYLKNHPDIYRPGVDFILWNTAIHLLLLYLFSEKKTQHIKVNN